MLDEAYACCIPRLLPPPCTSRSRNISFRVCVCECSLPSNVFDKQHNYCMYIGSYFILLYVRIPVVILNLMECEDFSSGPAILCVKLCVGNAAMLYC